MSAMPTDPDTTPPEEATSTVENGFTWRRIGVLLGSGSRKRWVGLALLALVVSLLEAANAALIYALVALLVSPETEFVLPIVGDLGDWFTQSGDFKLVIWATAVAALFFITRGILYLVQSYVQNQAAYNTGVALSQRLLRGYLSTPYPIFLRRNSAELIRNAHESTLLFAQLVLFPGIALASEATVALSLCIVLFLTAPIVTMTGFGVLGVLVLVMLRGVQPRLLRLGRQAQDTSMQSLQSLQQTLHGFRDVKVLGREAFFETQFISIRKRMARAYYLRAILVDAPRLVLETTLFLFILAFIAIQIQSEEALQESLGALGVFGYGALRILPSVNRIVHNVQSIRFGKPLIDQLHEDLIVAESYSEPMIGASADISFERTVQFENVSFRYAESRGDAVHGASLEVLKGQKIGVVGPTGSGKSTLVDLLLGLLEPTSGAIRIDGVDLRGAERSWHRSLGLVSQHVFLIDDSIRRNIALGAEDAEVSETDLQDAAEVAQLAGFLAELPDGLETQVGEQGVQLSGGQRQRIAIARALYRRTDVLILDEGTSALDTATETRFLSSLLQERPNTTLFMVTHRLSSIRQCDLVLVLDGGRVVGLGTFDDLARSNPVFQSLMSSDWPAQ